jgi:hypothetical protein
MIFDLRNMMQVAESMIPKVSSHQRAILENYRMHALLEISGRYEEIFTPELTVDHPYYRTTSHLGTEHHDGRAAVISYYRRMIDGRSNVLWFDPEYLAVEDWGISTEVTINTFMPGRTAIASGHEIDDIDAIYLEHKWVMMRWPYNEQAKMIGENVYKAKPHSIRKVAPEDVILPEQVTELLAPLLAAGPFFR